MTAKLKQAIVYFDAKLHCALRLKAEETDRSLSDLVNDAVEISLAEDTEDIEAFERCAREPNLSFKDVVKDLKQRRKI